MTDETGPDWAAIRLAVESGEGTQQDIAARFNVGLSALAMRKFRGGWMSPQDIQKLIQVEEGIDNLAAAMMRRLKQGARHGDALNARARQLAHAKCDTQEVLARLEMHLKTLGDMAPVLKMTADLTRLMERKARASAGLRAAHAALEAKNDRPDFVAFERAVLAHIAAALTEEDMEELAARDVESRDGLLGVPET